MTTAVIGGGLGGMVTALYLQQQGEEVTVFEKSRRLGGRLAYVEHEDYKIDEGPTIVLLPEIIKEIFTELHIDPAELELTEIDPLYPLHFKDGRMFKKWRDPARQKTEISRVFPGEEKEFDLYLSDMRERFEKGKPAFLDKEFVDSKSFWTKKNMATLIKLKAYASVKSQTKKYFKSKQLQEAFMLQTLYIGGSPEQTPAIYSLVSFSEYEHGIWYVQGGYARLAEILEKEMTARNIKIHTGTEVEDILIEGNRAVSAKIKGGLLEFDKFVLNGDFPVAEKLVRKESQRNYQPSSGCVLIYMGVEGMIDTEYVHQFFMGEDMEKEMREIFKEKRLPSDPSCYVFNPSLIDPSLAPEGKSAAYVLIPVPVSDTISEDEYVRLGEKVLDELTVRMDSHLKDKIVWKKIRTPFDGRREGLFEGGSFGIAPSLLQSGVFRPQVKPYKYENIYAVGASVHPGGGVPIVMQGAKILADLIAREREEQRIKLPENEFVTGVGRTGI